MPRDACPLGGRFSPVCMLVSAKFMADMGATGLHGILIRTKGRC
jgi:hypothetical protein